VQVVEVVTESLTLLETPVPTKVARLMLLSDILHNSSAPVKNASAYRTGFQAALPDVLESFNEVYQGLTGRITAESLKVCVAGCRNLRAVGCSDLTSTLLCSNALPQ